MTNAAEQQGQLQFLEFSSEIANIAEDEQYDFATIFNGLAVVTAAYVVDYVADMDGNTSQEDIDQTIADFVKTLKAATVYASEQLKDAIEEAA